MENNLKDQHYKNMDITLQMDTLAFEAESIAYIVCNHFGLDTSEYSFTYIASWCESRDMKALKASMDTIRKTSAEIIGNMEKAVVLQSIRWIRAESILISLWVLNQLKN